MFVLHNQYHGFCLGRLQQIMLQWNLYKSHHWLLWSLKTGGLMTGRLNMIFLKTEPGKWQNLSVFSKTFSVSSYRFHCDKNDHDNFVLLYKVFFKKRKQIKSSFLCFYLIFPPSAQVWVKFERPLKLNCSPSKLEQTLSFWRHLEPIFTSLTENPGQSAPAASQTKPSKSHSRPLNSLTHYGLVTPYGDRDLGQHWLR